MHEMSLCESLIQIIEQQAQVQHYSKVKKVWLEVGGLSGIEPEAMRFSFDVVTRDTLADGAELKMISIPGQAWCMHCCKNVTIQQRYDECPDCGGYQLQVNDGEQMRIKELEVE